MYSTSTLGKVLMKFLPILVMRLRSISFLLAACGLELNKWSDISLLCTWTCLPKITLVYDLNAFHEWQPLELRKNYAHMIYGPTKHDQSTKWCLESCPTFWGFIFYFLFLFLGYILKGSYWQKINQRTKQ